MELFQDFQAEGFAMPYTMEDFERDFAIKHFRRLTPELRQKALQTLPPEERQKMLQTLPVEERQKMLQTLPPEELLAGLSEEQIRDYLDRLSTRRTPSARKPKRKKA